MSRYNAGPGMSHGMEHMSLDPGQPFGQAAVSVYPASSATLHGAGMTTLAGGQASFAQPGTSYGMSYASPETMYQDRSQVEPAYQQHQTIPKYELDRIYQDAVDIQYHERQLLHERVVHTEEKQETQVIRGRRQTITIEKVVEVPQVVVKETIRRVAKPEIVERIIEVPKTEIKKRTTIGPPQVQYQEQIIEVPQVIIEERVIHVPGPRTVQERLIEVPKVEWVERVEYDDYIEYREVPVDKIIEVPEIEYRIREVEHLVPQTYVQEYFVDRYREVPVTQVQEVERTEHVQIMVPPSYGVQQQQGYHQPAQAYQSYSSRSMNSSQAAPAPAVTFNSALQSTSSLGAAETAAAMGQTFGGTQAITSGQAFGGSQMFGGSQAFGGGNQAYGGSQAFGATQAFGGSSYGASEAMAQPVQLMAMSYANYDPSQVGQNAAVGSQFMVPRGSMGPPGTQPFSSRAS
ncbi:unnamed protein product [Polarella glacialis]|nr:unnamed protein product [Polarella glacialis]